MVCVFMNVMDTLRMYCTWKDVISVGGLFLEDVALLQCCDSFLSQMNNTKPKNLPTEWENEFNT